MNEQAMGVRALERAAGRAMGSRWRGRSRGRGAAAGWRQMGPSAFEALESRALLAADLSGSLALSGGTFAPGASISGGMLTIRNLGDTPSDFVPIRAVLSSNNVFGDADDRLLGVFLREALAAGGESTTPETFVIPTDTPAGSYFLLIGIDPDNQIAEDNEGNNVAGTAAASIAVAGTPVFPDLGVTLGAVAGTFLPGQEVSATLTVRNTGSASADNFVTRIVLSVNNVFGDGDDISVEEIPEMGLGGILPGESFTETGTIFIPTGIAPGSYFILAKIDANNVVQESNEANNVYRSASATVVISPPPTVRIAASDAAAGETNNPGRFTLTRTGPLAQALSVNVVYSGSALVGDDYASLSTIVTFAPGSATAVIDVSAIDDLLVESPETIVATVAGGQGYVVSPTQAIATITIADNEPTISVVATDAVMSESAGNTALLTFTRTGGVNTGPLTVFYAAVPPSNVEAGIDYVAFSGMVTFAAGSATATVTIAAIDDALVEASRTLVIRISSDPSYRVSATQHTATLSLLDDEPTVSIAATRHGAEGGQSAIFTFTRAQGTSAGALTVFFQYVGGGVTTATPGPDFANVPSQITFAPGATTATLELVIADDNLAEPTEAVGFALIGNLSYRLGTVTSAVVTIADNEPTVTVTAPDATGSETAGDGVRFTFTRGSGTLAGSLTVFYTLSGTASNDGTDFTATPGLFGQITIPDGQASASVTIVPRDDAVAEADETIVITLNADTRFRLPPGGSSATATIRDNEPVVSVVAAGPTAGEGGGTALRYTFTRTGGPTTQALTVNFTFGGTATLGSDFASNLSVVIPAGQASVTLSITPTDDTLVEPSESVVVALAASAAYRVSTTQGSATGTITDNEATISVAATDPAAGEAAVGGQPNIGRFTLTRSGPGVTTGTLTVNYVLSGTATMGGGGADFQTLFGSVTFAAGSATATVTITAIDDAVAEDAESVVLSIGWGEGYRIDLARSAATVTIADDEPTISIVATVPGAAEGGAAGRFTVTRTGPTTQAVTVMYTLAGTAGAEDFGALSGMVTIPAGAASAFFSVVPVDDQVTEAGETVIATLAASAGYRLAAAQAATVTIADNEPTIAIRASDPQGRENDGDPVRFVFTRTGPTTQALTVNYTVGGQATAGADFAAPGGTIVIPAGALSAELVIAPTQDQAGEGPESVIVTLADGAGYRLPAATAARSALATIADDEPTVMFSIVNLGTTEGSGPLARVTVTRTGLSPQAGAITVNYVLSGSATAGLDYVAPAGSITIGAGAATASFEILGLDDTEGETSETIVLALSAGTGYIIGTQGNGQIIIQDNEPTVTVSVPDAAAGESTGGHGRFVVTRSGSPLQALTVNYVIEGTASNGVDFGLLSGTVVIPAGQTFVNVDVEPQQDTTGEGPETVILRVVSGTGYRAVPPATAATVVISDDEPVISVAASDGRATEGNTDTARFTLTRTGTVGQALTVSFTLGGTATGSDYAPIAGEVTFAAGATTASVTITALTDALAEVDETVVLTLTGEAGYRPATGAAGAASVTIAASGPVVSVAASDPAAGETPVGAAANPGRWTVTRTGPLAEALVVRYHLEGTAEGADYAMLSGMVTILAGQTSATIDLTVVDDAVGEAAETVVLVLDADDAYRLPTVPAQRQGAVSIADNEPVVTIVAADPTASENGTDTARLLVTRTGPLTQALTVNYTLAGSAGAGDFQPLSGSVVIAAGAASASIVLTAIPDLIVEGNETVIVNLGAGAYRIGTGASATATIVNVGQPDLMIAGLNAIDQAFSLSQPGQMLTFEVEYENLGAAAAGPFVIEVRLSADDVFGNADDVVLRAVPIASLGALSSGSLMLAVLLDGVSPPVPGAYRIGARIDALGRVAESDEANNVAFTPAGVVTISA